MMTLEMRNSLPLEYPVFLEESTDGSAGKSEGPSTGDFFSRCFFLFEFRFFPSVKEVKLGKRKEKEKEGNSNHILSLHEQNL